MSSYDSIVEDAALTWFGDSDAFRQTNLSLD